MKTDKLPPGSQPKLVLQLSSWCSYLDETAELEQWLQKQPASLWIEFVGIGEIPSDTVLLIRSLLRERSPRTRLITHARSSLQGAAVLLWLLGDERLIREDARLHFRAAGPFEGDETASDWRASEVSAPEDLEAVDYVRVLRLINEFLPVRELAGQFIERSTLQEFGLVDSQKMDGVLQALLGTKRKAKPIRAKARWSRSRTSSKPFRKPAPPRKASARKPRIKKL